MIILKPKSLSLFLCKNINCLPHCPQDKSLVSQCGVFQICLHLMSPCDNPTTIYVSKYSCSFSHLPFVLLSPLPGALFFLLFPWCIQIPFLLANAPHSWLGPLFLRGLPPHPQVISVHSMLCPTLLIPVLHLLVYLCRKQEFYSSLLRWKKCHIPLFLKLKLNVLLILILLNHKNPIYGLLPSPTLP